MSLPKVFTQKERSIPLKFRRAAEMMVVHLKDNKGITRAELLRDLKVRKQTFMHTLNKLTNLGIIKKKGKGVRGQPFQLFLGR